MAKTVFHTNKMKNLDEKSGVKKLVWRTVTQHHNQSEDKFIVKMLPPSTLPISAKEEITETIMKIASRYDNDLACRLKLFEPKWMDG